MNHDKLHNEIAQLRQRLWAAEMLVAERDRQIALLEKLVEAQKREMALLKGSNKRGAA